jgi:hypothetical protein
MFFHFEKQISTTKICSSPCLSCFTWHLKIIHIQFGVTKVIQKIDSKECHILNVQSSNQCCAIIWIFKEPTIPILKLFHNRESLCFSLKRL